MRLSARLRDAMVLLGEKATPETAITDEMLRQLAANGIVEFNPDGTVKSTDEGANYLQEVLLKAGIFQTVLIQPDEPQTVRETVDRRPADHSRRPAG